MFHKWFREIYIQAIIVQTLQSEKRQNAKNFGKNILKSWCIAWIKMIYTRINRRHKTSQHHILSNIYRQKKQRDHRNCLVRMGLENKSNMIQTWGDFTPGNLTNSNKCWLILYKDMTYMTHIALPVNLCKI